MCLGGSAIGLIWRWSPRLPPCLKPTAVAGVFSSTVAAQQRDAQGIVSLRLRLLDCGYAPMPVARKVPAISDWQRFGSSPPSAETIRCWQAIRPNATSTGIVCGSIRVIDADVDDPALAQRCRQAIEAIVGDLPCIRIGRWPHFAVFCRSADPLAPKRRSLCAKGAIDWIGRGGQVVVDGVHPGTGRPYFWLEEPLWETMPAALPLLSPEQEAALDAAFEQILGGRNAPPGNAGQQPITEALSPPADGLIPVGHRNDSLFQRLCDEAHCLDDANAILRRAEEINRTSLHSPLPLAEVKKIACSVTNYKANGRLYRRGQPSVRIYRVDFDSLAGNVDALFLLLYLRFRHDDKPGKEFALAVRAMSQTLPMSEKRIRAARDVLRNTGFLIQTHIGGGKGKPHRYRLR